MLCTTSSIDYPHKFHEYFPFELIFDHIGFLVDEPEDIGWKHGDEILSIPEQLLVVFPIEFLFIQGQRPRYIVFHNLPVMIEEKGHEVLHLHLQVDQFIAVESCPGQHGLVVVDPPQEDHQVTVLLLLLDLLEVGEYFILDVSLVLALVQLHYREFFGEAQLHIVVHVDQIFCGEFGVLDNIDQILCVG
jgi:hypothetical protein